MADNNEGVRSSKVSLSELAKDGERLKSVGLYHSGGAIVPGQVFERYVHFYKLLREIPIPA